MSCFAGACRVDPPRDRSLLIDGPWDGTTTGPHEVSELNVIDMEGGYRWVGEQDELPVLPNNTRHIYRLTGTTRSNTRLYVYERTVE